MSGPYCAGCGRTADTCPSGRSCTGPYEPPRFCTTCGRRLRVVVTPSAWSAACRDHGAVEVAG